MTTYDPADSGADAPRTQAGVRVRLHDTIARTTGMNHNERMALVNALSAQDQAGLLAALTTTTPDEQQPLSGSARQVLDDVRALQQKLRP